jgi:hypothetical protein
MSWRWSPTVWTWTSLRNNCGLRILDCGLRNWAHGIYRKKNEEIGPRNTRNSTK